MQELNSYKYKEWIVKKQIDLSGNIITLFSDDEEIQFLGNMSIPLVITNKCFHLKIYLVDENGRKLIDEACMRGKHYVQASLLERNEILADYQFAYSNINNQINKFYLSKGIVYGLFPYVSDRFCIAYMPGSNELFIFGKVANLDRILQDLISLFTFSLPVHSSAYEQNERSTLVLGISGSGKSNMLYDAIMKGGKFISDDCTAIYKENMYRISSYIAIRNYVNGRNECYMVKGLEKQQVPALQITPHVINERLIEEVILLSDEKEYMRTAFPNITKGSYWIADLLGIKVDFEIQLKNSVNVVKQLLEISKVGL